MYLVVIEEQIDEIHAEFCEQIYEIIKDFITELNDLINISI